MRDKLKLALADQIWQDHIIGNNYHMDGKSDNWKIVYYPIFEDGKNGEVYQEPRGLVEKPIFGGLGEKIGIDYREVPLRYLNKADNERNDVIDKNPYDYYKKEPVLEDIISFDSEGFLDGECTYYYPNGNLEAIGHWDHGNKVGLWKEYNNKRLWFISYYTNRIQEGEEITYCYNGVDEFELSLGEIISRRIFQIWRKGRN